MKCEWNNSYLSPNRKHHSNTNVETQVEVWEKGKCFRRVFPQLFQVLPNFHERKEYKGISESSRIFKKWKTCEVYTCTLWNNLYFSPNRKHLLCFFQVIETQVEVRENEECCRWVFPQVFQVLSPFLECFYNSIETGRTCIYFFQKTLPQKKE